jgi:hypothetical protein
MESLKVINEFKNRLNNIWAEERRVSQAGEICIVRSFIVCTLDKILLG